MPEMKNWHRLAGAPALAGNGAGWAADESRRSRSGQLISRALPKWVVARL